ncbi:hypothetical protein EXM60_18115 [Clostridium botulinum]|nr:hypothetical protein [Clostridium botulinum]NFA18359.1 hypothetical protein [Clostridium botulinum]NFA55109.1 hypothetical protein [Clostridium botulinum]NFA68728.1 hypothetical protein [Clostridium botulinum]NFE17053.1 hypothetical protein [Clostridium botulinum]
MVIIEKNNIKFDVIKNDYIFLILSLCKGVYDIYTRY